MSMLLVKIYRDGAFAHQYTIRSDNTTFTSQGTANWMAERAAEGVSFKFEEDGKPILPVVKKRITEEATE
jgi:hypothetical protein